MMEDVARGFKFALILVMSGLIISAIIVISMFISGTANNKDNMDQSHLYYSEDGEHFYPYNNNNKSEWHYIPTPVIMPYIFH